jgi:hypothetical protein
VKALRYWWCLPLAGVAFLILKEAFVLVPEAWPSFQDALHPKNITQVDSGLFEGDSTLEEASADTSIDAVCKRAGVSVQSAATDVRSVKNQGEKLGLCSFELRTGRPLIEQVWELSQTLEKEGYALSESSERGTTKYPWLGRITRNGTVHAIVRARIGDKPMVGAYTLRLVLWADSLPATVLGRLEKLPAHTILALPAAALAEERLQRIAMAAKLHLALLIRLETERKPLVLQQKTRILLHHTQQDVEKRMQVGGPNLAPIEGLVVLDGERGIQDPSLAGRVASVARDHRWWVLDATQAPGSRLDSAARAFNLTVLPHPSRLVTPKASLESAIADAQRLSRGIVNLPLDTSTLDLVRHRVPLMEPQGVRLQPPVEPDSILQKE